MDFYFSKKWDFQLNIDISNSAYMYKFFYLQTKMSFLFQRAQFFDCRMFDESLTQ